MALLVGSDVAGMLSEKPAAAQVVEPDRIADLVLAYLDSGEVTVAAYGGAWREYEEIIVEARKRGLNPYLYTPVDAVELELLAPHASPGTLLAAKYAAALASMAGKALTRATPRKAVDRRTLLTNPLAAVVEYAPAPILLNPSMCGSWKHCSACVEACPHGALEGKPPQVDVYKCTGCGVCTAACPFGLLLMPKYNIKAYDYLLDKIRRETREPGVAVAVCTSMLGALSEGLESLGERPGYPIVFVPVECPGWFTEFHMLLSAARGFDVLVACDDARSERCADGGAVERWLEEMEPLGARRGVIGSVDELVEELAGHRPRSRVLEGVESLVADKTAAYRILAAYGVERARFSSPIVAHPLIDEDRCLVCDACANMCPYRAIQVEYTGDEKRIVFNAEECTACGACQAACPYGALRLEYLFDKSILGKREVLARDEVARCRRCGRPIGSMKHLKLLEKQLRESGVDEWVIEQLWLCQECKVKSLIERGFYGQRGG